MKKNDGTTDVIYTGVMPASGSEPCMYKNNTVGTTAGQRPEFTISSAFNSARSARRVRAKLSWPVTETRDGITIVKSRMPIEITAPIPQDVDQSIIDEAVSQALNLFSHALCRSSFKEGYAPQ